MLSNFYHFLSFLEFLSLLTLPISSCILSTSSLIVLILLILNSHSVVVIQWLSLVRLFATPWTYTVHGILQPRILEWVAFPFSRGIFPTQGSSPGLLHCRQILNQLRHQGSPRILEWVAYPCSSGSSWPRNWTGSPALQVDSFPTELSGKPQSLLKFMSIYSVMLSNHLILCCPLLTCLQSFPVSSSFPMSQLFTSGGQSSQSNNCKICVLSWSGSDACLFKLFFFIPLRMPCNFGLNTKQCMW